MKRQSKKSETITLICDGISETVLVHPATNKYCDRINLKIRSEWGVIEEIISHQPSIGNYYERILSNTLSEYIPSQWKIGTGFIFDDKESNCSPQIDILIYDDSTISPIFKVGDLVVVRPSEVRGIIEVKKRLKLSDIDDLIDKYFLVNTGSGSKTNKSLQYLNIFSYETATKVEKYFDRVCSKLTSKIDSLKRGKENTGEERINAIGHVTLPRIFFLNEEQIIDCSLKKAENVHKVSVDRVSIPYTSGGASDLVSRFIWVNSDEMFGRNFLSTVNLYRIESSFDIPTPLIIRYFILVGDAYKLYPNIPGKMLWKKKELEGIIGFLVPAEFEINSLLEFMKLIQSRIIMPIPKR